MSQVDAVTKIKINESIREPSMFKVIYLNDNQTTMQFVVQSLVEFFDYTTETAVKLTGDIHEQGQAVVAILPFEIAEQKGSEVLHSARVQNFPLQIKIEPEEVQ
jgi:ATP-dependent Clp protease adaptor protein ClpS